MKKTLLFPKYFKIAPHWSLYINLVYLFLKSITLKGEGGILFQVNQIQPTELLINQIVKTIWNKNIVELIFQLAKI